MTDWTARKVYELRFRKPLPDGPVRWVIDPEQWAGLLGLADTSGRPLAMNYGTPYLMGDPVRFERGAELRLEPSA
jgi:hypothetical protein